MGSPSGEARARAIASVGVVSRPLTSQRPLPVRELVCKEQGEGRKERQDRPERLARFQARSQKPKCWKGDRIVAAEPRPGAGESGHEVKAGRQKATSRAREAKRRKRHYAHERH